MAMTEDEYKRLSVLPFKQNVRTKEISFGLPQFLMDAGQAISAPYRAYKGEFDPMSPQGLLEANNFNLNMALGGIGSTATKVPEAGVVGSYLKNTPKSPNELVGTRFKTESLNNLVPQKQIKPEDLLNASIKIIPYDMTSAGQRVLSVSDLNLTNPVETMGGIDFARIINNYNRNIGGASNESIAKRVLARTEQTRKENLAQGGSGEVYKIPITMAKNSEWFSTYPTDILKDIVLNNSSKKDIKAFNEMMRNASVVGKPKLRPYGNFKGIETPEGQMQFLTGEGFGKGGTSGEFRKSFVDRMSLKENQEKFGYNIEDVLNATLDPRLMNVPKGYGGLSIVRSIPDAILTPSSIGSKIGAYDTDIPAQYFGSLPIANIETLLPKTYSRTYNQMKKLYPSAPPEKLRNYTIGAIEKRKANIGEMVDQEWVDNFYKYQEGLLGR